MGLTGCVLAAGASSPVARIWNRAGRRRWSMMGAAPRHRSGHADCFFFVPVDEFLSGRTIREGPVPRRRDEQRMRDRAKGIWFYRWKDRCPRWGMIRGKRS